MGLHNTSLCYAFPYQNMEFHNIKILKEIIAKIYIYIDKKNKKNYRLRDFSQKKKN